MIEITRIDNETDLWFAQQVYLASFPEDERRDTAEWLALAHNEPRFNCCIIKDDGARAGIFTYWNFGDFCYVEHFAVDEQMRGSGIGARALSHILPRLCLPVVLEVEPPVAEIERRRIAFYTRNGFVLSDNPYVQPPYRLGGNSVPLMLMHYNFPDFVTHFPNVVTAIHAAVYHHPGNNL